MRQHTQIQRASTSSAWCWVAMRECSASRPGDSLPTLHRAVLCSAMASRMRWTLHAASNAGCRVSLQLKPRFLQLVVAAYAVYMDMVDEDDDIDPFIMSKTGHDQDARGSNLQQVPNTAEHRSLESCGEPIATLATVQLARQRLTSSGKVSSQAHLDTEAGNSSTRPCEPR